MIEQHLARHEQKERETVPCGWDPDLADQLCRLLYGSHRSHEILGEGLRQLELAHGDAVFAELIHLLSHLRFEPSEAKRHWSRIVEHRDAIASGLGVPVDLRVALVSYFVHVDPRLENPKVIELSMFAQTHAAAYKDELTGLDNRRSFEESLPREIHRCDRHNAPLSLVLIDIDDFADYNRRHGHQGGDEALADIAELITANIRKVDVAARYAGEEFAVVLPMTPKTDAREVAERLRLAISQHALCGDGSGSGDRLTVSVGVATFPGDAKDPSELIRRADAALCAAKDRGANQVELYEGCRRSYRRVPATLRGRLRCLSFRSYPVTTIDVSEGGVCFRTRTRVRVGEILDLRLELPGSRQEAGFCGRVARVQRSSRGKFETAVSILDINRKDRLLLAAYLAELSE